MSFPPIPVPSTWNEGEIVPAEILRDDVSSTVQFLANRPTFVGNDPTGPSVSGTEPMPVEELNDTWNGHADGTDPSQYFCQAPGWYLCQADIPFDYTTATEVQFAAGFAGLSSGVAFGPNWGPLTENGSGWVPVARSCDLIIMHGQGAIGGAGDYVEFYLFAGTGTTLVTSTTQLPTVSVRWVAKVSGVTGLPVPTNPAWPVPPDYITSADMNANVRDTVRFLAFPPICKAVYTPGTTTLPSQTFPAGTVVAFGVDDAVVDNYDGFTGGTGSNYTAAVAGNYFCYGQINLNSSANDAIYCAGFSVNSGTTQWGDSVKMVATAAGGASVTKRLRLDEGDVLQFVASQDSGASIEYNTTGANQTRFIVVWEGA